MDYLATVGYVDALMLSTMDDENKKILFQKLLEIADQTGIDIALYAVKDKLDISIGSNGQQDASGNQICQTGYSFKSLVNLVIHLSAISRSTASQFKYLTEHLLIVHGKLLAARVRKFTFHVVIKQKQFVWNMSCPVNKDIKSSYHFSYKDSSEATSRIVNNQCNTITCINSSIAGTTASIFCCDMTSSQSIRCTFKDESTTSYFKVGTVIY